MGDNDPRNGRGDGPCNTVSAAVLAIWGKSPRDGQPAHQLLAHLLDAAACALALLEREPEPTRRQLGTDFGLPTGAALRWVALLCALHDLGKATPAFLFGRGYVAGDDALRAAGLLDAASRRPESPQQHGQLTQELVPRLLVDLGWQPLAARRAAEAIGAHHGKRFGTPPGGTGIPQQIGNDVWTASRKEIVAVVVRELQLDTMAAPAIDDLDASAFTRLAGLASFVDWIASSLEYGRDAGDPAAYFAATRKLAERRLEQIGWRRRSALLTGPGDFAALFPRCNPPNPLQQRMAELLADTDGPALFLIEAPMGEGKTEAALYAHACLQQRNGHRGLYFALPTQATGNAAFTRVNEFLAQFGRPLDLQLLHGSATLNREFLALSGPALRGIEDEDGELTEAADVQAREWFTHSKRALLSEYGVGTVDQALYAVLNVKHYFVRLWGLANRVVVIDEVHAYDTYTSTLIATLLRWLRAVGSSAIVMSATLPAMARKHLLGAWDAGDAPAGPYPRLTRVAAGRSLTTTFATRTLPETSRQVAIGRLAADIATVADTAFEQTAAGGCALVVVNTVGRAQDVYAHLRDRGDADCELLLFHSRFPAFRREQIETDLRQRFGRDGSRRPRRAILVATQVCEQSIDVDFDVLVTDLAPMDLILQRMGRMHRHDRRRPDRLRRPCVWIAGTHDYPAQPPVENCNWHYVYDKTVLLATAHVLAQSDSIAMPADIDRLVQQVYPPDIGKWPQAWQAEGCELDKDRKHEEEKHEGLAKALSIGDPDDPNSWTGVKSTRLDDDDATRHAHVRAATRLGDGSLKVVFLHRIGSDWSLDAAGEQRLPDRGAGLDEATTFELYRRSIPVANRALVKAILTLERPDWVRGSPLLRQVHAVAIDAEGKAVVGGIPVVLDGELGLVISKP